MDDRVKKFLSSKDENILVIYGIRKSGKTNYIKNAIKGRKEKVIYYEMKNTNEKENFLLFRNRVSEIFSNKISCLDFPSIFKELASAEERLIIIIENADLLFKFSEGIAEDIKKAAKAQRIILTTSQADFSKELCRDERFLSIDKPVSKYYESFEPLKVLPYSKQLQFQLVFGSSEFVVSKIDPEESLKRNVRNLLLSNDSIISEYIEHELFEDLGKKSYAFLILSILKDRRMRYGDLVEETGQKYNGLLDKQLNILIDLGLVRKTYPINRKIDRKKVLYEISDNLLRFYFTYVHPNRSRIQQFGVDAVFEQFVEPSLSTYLSYRFEDIARSYFQRAVRAGLLKGVLDVGTYWYDDAKRHRNGEFDFAVSYADGYDIIEVKHLAAPMDRLLADEEIRKIRGIDSLKVRRIGFVSLEGFTFADPCCILISGADLFASELELPASSKRLE